MSLPNFEKLFRVAIRITSFIEVMTALAPITQGDSTKYEGEPNIILKKDTVVIYAGGDLYVIFGEQQAIELLIETMLDRYDVVGSDLQIFRDACTQLWREKLHALTHEYQKANFAKLTADVGLLEQVWANLYRSVAINGESPETEEWRVLLTDYSILEISEIVLGHDEHAHQLRRYSPVRRFISEAERGEIYKRVVGRQPPPAIDEDEIA